MNEARTPERSTHFIWLDPGGPGFQEKRDAEIACGAARATDEFIAIFWKNYTWPDDGK